MEFDRRAIGGASAFVVLGFIGLWATAVSTTQTQVPDPASALDRAPTEILSAPPAPVPPMVVEPAADAAGELSRIHSMLVSHRGQVVLERYYNGTTPARLANLKSASKSVISALVGIAIDRSLIPGVEQSIGDYFADFLPGDDNAVKRSITIEDLLTMRSGLETTSNRNYGAWVLSSNWVRHALTRPLHNPPGSRMEYSTGNTHLLSAILTQASGTSTWRFAQDVLAEPLGFSLPRWPQDPQGIYFGGNDMLMTPRQLLAFGEMYLNGGRANGRQIVPREWVEASLTRRASSPREFGRSYGYGWWVRRMAGLETYYAWGYGGQFIFLVPDLGLVVVTTSNSNPGQERRSHLRRIYEIVEDHVVGPVHGLTPEATF